MGISGTSDVNTMGNNPEAPTRDDHQINSARTVVLFTAVYRLLLLAKTMSSPSVTSIMET